MSDEKQIVVFRLSGEEFGVDISEVKEIIKMEDITAVPDVPHYVDGIINLRGSIVVIIDIERKLNLPEKNSDKDTRIIIIEIGDNNTVGIVVDSATEVLRLGSDQTKPAPAAISSKVKSDIITGVATIKDRIIILLDLAKVIASDEILKLNAIKDKHQENVQDHPEQNPKDEKQEMKESKPADPAPAPAENPADPPKESAPAEDKPAEPSAQPAAAPADANAAPPAEEKKE